MMRRLLAVLLYGLAAPTPLPAAISKDDLVHSVSISSKRDGSSVPPHEQTALDRAINAQVEKWR